MCLVPTTQLGSIIWNEVWVEQVEWSVPLQMLTCTDWREYSGMINLGAGGGA